MRLNKFVITLLSLLFIFSVAQGQKKYIFKDTSLLQQDEQNLTDTITTHKIEHASSSEIDSAYSEEVDTTLQLNNLYLSSDSIKNWQNLHQYEYLKNLDSLLKQKNAKLKLQPPKAPPSPGFFSQLLNSNILKMVLWTLAVFFVGFIIYKLFLTEGVFKRNKKKITQANTNQPDEHITKDTDFNQLIKESLQNNQFRQAVRYQYLRSLHLLAINNIVSMASGKTNYEYVREIKNKESRGDFAKLTLNYEYIWYGNFTIDEKAYQRIEPGFTSFNNQIKTQG